MTRAQADEHCEWWPAQSASIARCDGSSRGLHKLPLAEAPHFSTVLEEEVTYLCVPPSPSTAHVPSAFSSAALLTAPFQHSVTTLSLRGASGDVRDPCLALSAQPRRLYGYARRPSPRCAARHDSDRVHVLAGHREPPATREATRHPPLPTVERTYRRVALSTSNAWNAEQGIATATTGGALLASHQCLSPTQQGNCRGNRSVTAQLTS